MSSMPTRLVTRGDGAVVLLSAVTLPMVVSAVVVMLLVGAILFYLICWKGSPVAAASAQSAAAKVDGGSGGSGGNSDLHSVDLTPTPPAKPRAPTNPAVVAPDDEVETFEDILAPKPTNEAAGGGGDDEKEQADAPVDPPALADGDNVVDQDAMAADQAARDKLKPPAKPSEAAEAADLKPDKEEPTNAEDKVKPSNDDAAAVAPDSAAEEASRSRRNAAAAAAARAGLDLPPLNAAGRALAEATDPDLPSIGGTPPPPEGLAARRSRRSNRPHQPAPLAIRSALSVRRGKVSRRRQHHHRENRQSLAYVLKQLKEGRLADCADDDPRPIPELLDENELALVQQSLGDGSGGPDSTDPSLLAAMHRWNVAELREAIDRFVRETVLQAQPPNPTLPLREVFDEFDPEDMEHLEEALLAADGDPDDDADFDVAVDDGGRAAAAAVAAGELA